jgi:predicted RNA-binding Zn-ribbon protein involved in translation (DUF1610 family)
MNKTDRLKELEKIAEKLGIGQNREVKCVSCKKKIAFKDAIILTNKDKISYLCPECNKKLIKGSLTKKEIDNDELLKKIEEMQEEMQKGAKRLVPYIPNIPTTPDVLPKEPWRTNPDGGWKPYEVPYYYSNTTSIYKIDCLSSDTSEGEHLLKWRPTNANRKS